MQSILDKFYDVEDFGDIERDIYEAIQYSQFPNEYGLHITIVAKEEEDAE